MPGISRVVGTALWMLLAIGLATAARDAGAGRRFMTAAFGLSAADLARLDGGRVISRTLTAKDSREIATFGAVRIRITPEFYVQQFSDIARFKQGEAVAQIGAFSNPAAPPDIEVLTLDEPDLKGLSDCRVGDCSVQLPSNAIERVKKEVDWKAPGAQKHATTVVRDVLLNYVAEYQRSGPATPMQYADGKKVLDLEREFTSLMDSTPATWQHFPALRRHLVEYPARPAPSATDLLYWSKEKMGRKAVVSITHVAIVPGDADAPWAYAIASKHLYGSHYIDASLGLTVLVADSSSSSPATYVIYVNRSRVDVFGGIFGGLVRKIVTSRARETMDDQFGRLQRKLETQFAAVQTSNAR
jgi:hypothetical protein